MLIGRSSFGSTVLLNIHDEQHHSERGQRTAKERTMIVMVKQVKKGELVRIGKSVYVRDEYCREAGKYFLTRWDDINRERLVRGSQLVEVGFTF